MKLTIALSSLLLLLPLIVDAASVPEHLVARQRNGGGRGGNRGGNNNNKGGAAAASAAKPTATVAAGGAAAGGAAGGKGAAAGGAAAGGAAAGGAAAGGAAAGGKGAAAGGGDAQTSLTLDPAVIAKGFESDGQQVPTAGQVPSLTSSNNFINFCKTVNKPITDGKQVTGGSCNPAPMGVIASSDNMPSSKFTNPKNLDTIKVNTPFTIQMAINNLQTGNFVNAQSNYYAAPQQVNGAGTIIGHTHVVIEKIDALDTTKVTNPKQFAFFKGVNGAAVNGVVSADVTAGLPDVGTYRLASINAAANHQPCLVAIAQHGTLDDMVYFTVTADGKPGAAAAGGAAAGGAAAGGAAAGGAAAGGAKNGTAAGGAAAGGAKAGGAAAGGAAGGAAAGGAAAGGAKAGGAAAGGAAGANNGAKGGNNNKNGGKAGGNGRGGRRGRGRKGRSIWARED